MKRPLKYGIIGASIWILFLLIFEISGDLTACHVPTDELGQPLLGIPCWSSTQGTMVTIISLIGFPAILIGGNPNPDVGRSLIFWMGSLISFFLWGLLIGWITDKVKRK